MSAQFIYNEMERTDIQFSLKVQYNPEFNQEGRHQMDCILNLGSTKAAGSLSITETMVMDI